MKKKQFILCFIYFVACVAMETHAMGAKKLVWHFPLPRPHTGMLIGNGIQGLMIWGQENRLHITIGHGGFWDHRGANDLGKLTTFSELKDMLYADRSEDVRNMFSFTPKQEERPRQIGGGRLALNLPENYRLLHAELNLSNGKAVVFFTDPHGTKDSLFIEQAISQPVAKVTLPKALHVDVQFISSWQYVKGILQKTGIEPPYEFEKAKGVKGFVQTLPEDDPLAVGYRQSEGKVIFGSVLKKAAEQSLFDMLAGDRVEKLKPETLAWWATYWQDVPKISLPDPVLQEIVDYGLYKQACSTPPHAKAAGLQGPFNEEYQLPPWANDYHFNINVEMIYGPALASNRAAHLMPLWKMINSWLPELREKGERFYGRKNALIFPHAVDDRGQVIGQFWTGIIDKACAAWMADMAWKHYRYTLDRPILDTIAWPLLEGAFEAYWACLEEVPDAKGGKRYSLPVSISPEYGAAYYEYKRAWGRDASFELAALHCIAGILPKAAALLGKQEDPRWRDVSLRLPHYTTVDDIWMQERRFAGERIALWENLDYIESHRHHSHLAGIYPFCTIDPQDERHQKIVATTMRNWVFKGAGNWSGWSIPWASSIWSRLDNPEAAVMWLHYWVMNFVNEGRGSLYEAGFQGQTLQSVVPWSKRSNEPNGEKMQLDAAMSAVTAVFDLLLQQRNDVLVVLPSIHQDWKDFSFENILAEGAFLVSAKVEGGQKKEITIVSQKGGKLQLDHGLGGSFFVNGKPANSPVFTADTTPGELIKLTVNSLK